MGLARPEDEYNGLQKQIQYYQNLQASAQKQADSMQSIQDNYQKQMDQLAAAQKPAAQEGDGLFDTPGGGRGGFCQTGYAADR